MVCSESEGSTVKNIAPRLRLLLDDIRVELTLDPADRATGAPDSSLKVAIDLCQQAVVASDSGDQSSVCELLGRLSRLVVDEWSLTSPLTAAAADSSRVAGC